MNGEEVTSKPFIQSIQLSESKMVEPPVHDLPLTSDSVKEFFYSIKGTIKTAFFGFLEMISSSVYYIAKYAYNIVYICMEAWFYHGSSFIPGFYGNAGLSERDMCAKLIGTSSDLFQGDGSSMCKKYIHQIVSERTAMTCLILVCLYLRFGYGPTFDFFHSIYNYRDYELKRLAREKANEQSKRTKKKNADISALLQAITAILRVDDTGFVSQINALRNLLSDVKNEDVIESINWPTDRTWLSQGYSINRQMLMNLGNGPEHDETKSDEVPTLRLGDSTNN